MKLRNVEFSRLSTRCSGVGFASIFCICRKSRNQSSATSDEPPVTSHQPATSSQQSQSNSRQAPGKGAGGRRPKSLKSGHRALRAKGTAVAKRYGGGESAARLNPSQINLFTQGSPRLWQPAAAPPFSAAALLFVAFSTCQTGRHRRRSKRAPRGLRKVILRVEQEPSDRKISTVFFECCKLSMFMNQQHRSTSPYGVLEFQQGTRRSLES